MNALTEATVSLLPRVKAWSAAEENYRVRRELYRAGKATVVDVTDAETDLTRSRLDVVNSHVTNASRAWRSRTPSTRHRSLNHAPRDRSSASAPG